jgi:hypothetical protein
MKNLILFLIIFHPLISNGQIRGANNILSIGTMGLKKTVFSGPLIINDSSCFTVSNGIKTLKAISKNELFKLNCEVLFEQQSKIILFTTYPNPVNNYTFLKFINKEAFINLKEVAMIHLYDNSGNLYNKFTTTFFDITNGYKINLSNLHSGNYYILIHVGKTNYQQIIKILKN